MKTLPLSLGNVILLKENVGMRQSVPRQVDRKSRVLEEERWGLGLSKRREGSGILKEEETTSFFSPIFLSKYYITIV